MKKTRKPKNVLQFKVPEKSVPSNLASVEWLKELQEALKKQSEAAIALVKLTTDAAQRIHRYTHYGTQSRLITATARPMPRRIRWPLLKPTLPPPRLLGFGAVANA